jgi:hypothetical protein
VAIGCRRCVEADSSTLGRVVLVKAALPHTFFIMVQLEIELRIETCKLASIEHAFKSVRLQHALLLSYIALN